MNIIKRQYQKDDLKDVVSLFNEVIETGLYLEEDTPVFDDFIESAPKDGPTLLFSSKLTVAGSAPLLSAIATFPASATVNPPEICPLPPPIRSLIFGAE